MKKQIIFLVMLILTTTVQAAQLVCKGQQPQMQNQKTIYVDCSNRKEVIDMLGAAWRELRKQSIGGST